MFIDLGKVFRHPAVPGTMDRVAVDENGWPVADFEIYVFDVRPCCAFDPVRPQVDDPARFQPDWSGNYSLSFTGRADVSASPGASVMGLVYDEAANTTRGVVQVGQGVGYLQLAFTNTQRTADSAPGSGISGLHIIRPGYAAETSEVFTREFLNLLRPFRVLKFTGFSYANDADPSFPLEKLWSHRHLVTDATQYPEELKKGVAWEYSIRLANDTGKDMWINVPVSAGDDYVARLAMLVKENLKPGLRVYVEHGNEVWFPGFTSYKWNTPAAAGDEVLRRNPDSSDPSVWSVRRHARRTMEIGGIFRRVFGAGSEQLVRPVLAWRTARPNEFRSGLEWVRTNYGPPSQFFWGIAQAHYATDAAVAVPSPGADDLLAAMRADSDGGVAAARVLHELALEFGIAHAVYEGGPDSTAQAAPVASRIRAGRDAGAKDLLLHQVRDNWFGLGEDYGLYMFPSAAGLYSRYGTASLVEDAALPNTPKYQAVEELAGAPPAPAISDVSSTASAQTAAVPGAFLSVYGTGFTLGSAFDWTAGVGGVLPTELGGVRVLVNGQRASIQYAGASQVNVLLPAELQGTEVTVEVFGPGGVAVHRIAGAAVAPGFFGQRVGERFYPSALFGNSGVYVAPVGTWPAVTSRPAKPGDFIELYVSGLPMPAGVPSGRVLDRVVAIDPSSIHVTIDGMAARVAWAGLRYAGVFQVNVEVPAVARSGDLPIVLEGGGRTTQPAVLAVERP